MFKRQCPNDVRKRYTKGAEGVFIATYVFKGDGRKGIYIYSTTRDITPCVMRLIR